MARRYRKIDSRIWNDEKFRALSDDAQLAFLFVLTHPHMTMLGAMRTTIAGLAAEKGWSTKRMTKALGEAFGKALLRRDEQAAFLWAPHFLRYNSPESPNVVKSWESVVDLLPECALKSQLLQGVKDFLEDLPEAFRKAFQKAIPNQEQEQEQEQDIKTPPTPPKKTPGKKPKPDLVAADTAWSLASDAMTGTALLTQAFRVAWAAWVAWCLADPARKSGYTMHALKAQVRKLERMGHDDAIAALENATGRWQGVFEPGGRGPGAAVPASEARPAPPPGKYADCTGVVCDSRDVQGKPDEQG